LCLVFTTVKLLPYTLKIIISYPVISNSKAA
jgi:hypothetical protein